MEKPRIKEMLPASSSSDVTRINIYNKGFNDAVKLYEEWEKTQKKEAPKKEVVIETKLNAEKPATLTNSKKGKYRYENRN